MEDITIEGTPKTPEVRFNAADGKLLIKGRSIPENSVEFYKPLLDWIEQYGEEGQNSSPTEVDMQLEYFNTSSSKCILDVFKKLEEVKNGGKEININWYYEEDDEDMLEAGEDYQAIINIPFKMVEVEEI